MKRPLLVFLFIFACFTLAHSQTVHKEFLDGMLYVKFTKASLKSVSREDPRNIPLSKLSFLQDLFVKYGVTKIYKPFYQADDDDFLPYILKMEFTQVTEIRTFIDELAARKEIEYAEKVGINKTDVVPNDPLFASTSGSTHLNQIDAQNAWNVFNGNSNITVAIVDNAIMKNHADLAANIYTNTVEANGTTGVDDDGNGYIDDINGYDVADWDNVTDPSASTMDHGTHCAGIAGANNNNAIGIASIGWNIKIIPVKTTFNATSTFTINRGYEGILYAVKAKAKIISCSWSNSGGPSISEQALIDYAWNRGCIIIASAGNLSSTTPAYPGAYNHVYCVAWVDPNDVKNTQSNYGSWVDISAPGTNILSTVPYGSTPAYANYGGTSMATPMVAGLAALMLSKSPNMTRTDVLNCLSSTAVNIYTIGGNSGYVSGSMLGAGRINAFAAMNCAATFSALPPVANFYAFLPKTCPNTLIPFIDSSLYNPTSWSWVFQGGTPATSTSSNPSVQWSTPGTYSVSLTVTNANGNNSISRLSYITVAGPAALPFSEGFQSPTFLPPNWVANNLWNDPIYWERTTLAGGFGTSTACAWFNNYDYNAPGEHDEMRTPSFDFTNIGGAHLKFDVAYARYDAFNSDTLEVKVSTNCGTSWSSIYIRGGTTLSTTSDQTNPFVPTSSQWRTETIDVSSITAGQGRVMFSFLNRGHYGQPIYVDNINLSFPTPTLGANSSASVCINPAYTFSNTSVGAINYTWTFQGGSPASSTASNPSVTYASPGTYTYNLAGINGTLSANITKTITVLPNVTVAATSGSYCSGQTYTLNGSGASSYTWSSISGTLANTASLAITPSASSFYTLTGSNGACTADGIYTITVVNGPSISVADQTICAGNSATLTASGATSYSWSTTATLNSVVVTPATSTDYTVSGITGNCSTTETVSVNVAAYPSAILSVSNASCANSCNGIVNATSSGGTGPYTYNLANSGCTALPCLNVCAGSYTLHTSNAEGCVTDTPFTISVPTAVQSLISGSGAGCATCGDGSLSVSASGGVGPYTYTWMPSGGNTAMANNLLPGCYTVTILDANGCNSSASACVEVGTGLQTFLLAEALMIYPNPAQNHVVVSLKGRQFNCNVYTSLGQLLLSRKDIKDLCPIDMSEFAKGIYMIEVESGSEKVWKKLVIE